jgi:hypothetical protein
VDRVIGLLGSDKVSDKLVQAVATCPKCGQHVEFKFSDKTGAQMSDKPTDDKTYADYKAMVPPDESKFKPTDAKSGRQIRRALYRHIDSLRKEREEINLTCRGFEADAISRELDILNLKNELAALTKERDKLSAEKTLTYEWRCASLKRSVLSQRNELEAIKGRLTEDGLREIVVLAVTDRMTWNEPQVSEELWIAKAIIAHVLNGEKQ